MNTKDFVVLPWGKPGHSVKLKYKHAQELRMEKVQLELENKEMEKKLQEFQSTWNKEKEEIKSSGYHWKAGRVAKLGNQSHIRSQNKGNAIKLSTGKVKLKLLKQQTQEPIKQAVNYTMANFHESEKSQIKGKVCGQCERKAALLVCFECGEDYCSGCFAKIHQKGALRLHRTTLLQGKTQILSNVLDAAHRFIKEVNPEEPKGGNNSTKGSNKSPHKPKPLLLQGSSSEVEITTTKIGEHANPRDRVSCEGSFDEAASAQSFQEAVSQWRMGTHKDNKERNFHASKPDSQEECEVQTNLKIWTEPINIEFTEDSLSYMEKLWLKKHRRTPQELPETLLPPHATTSEAQASQNEGSDDSDVEETKVKYPPLFMPVEELNTKRPDPSLTIMELDDTYEEDYGRPGNTVPYKVELTDSESQLRHVSYKFPGILNNCFPCESGICQHHVFNKGRLDLSYLCLRSSPTYCKDGLKEGTSNTDFDIINSDKDSPDIKKIEKNSSTEGNAKNKDIDPDNIQKTDDFCILLGNKDSLSPTNSDTTFIKDVFSQNNQDSLEFSNLHEKPSLKYCETMKSPLLLQEIALRNKPVHERYKGLEGFFTFGQNEPLNLFPSQRSESSHSSSRLTLEGDREWVPEHSFSADVDNVLQRVENPPPRVRQQNMGQKPQRTSSANLPLSTSVTKCSICPSPHPPSRSGAAHSLSRAASEISEIEYIDSTDQPEPYLDHTADQHTLDSLGKELNALRNLTDPSEKPSSLSSEELPASNHNLWKISEISADFFKTSDVWGSHGAEELISSGKDTGMHSLLSLSDYSTDEDEENLLDKQQVMTLPWSKNI